MKQNTYKTKVQEFPGKVSQTKFMTIPKVICDNLDLMKGDDIECIIIKINEVKVIRQYKCIVDNYIFHSDDDIPYCPICGNDSKNVIKEVRG